MGSSTFAIRVLRAPGHQVLLTIADPALHDLTVAALRVLVASMAFARGVCAFAFAASLQADLNVIVREKETSAKNRGLVRGIYPCLCP